VGLCGKIKCKKLVGGGKGGQGKKEQKKRGDETPEGVVQGGNEKNRNQRGCTLGSKRTNRQ